MNYIKLTEVETGRNVWVNLDHIMAIEQNGDGAIIALSSKSGYEVQESVEVILRAIEIWGLDK
jgi:uncharacterized protein YlzI (FlbEa/FlbD family)